MRLTILLLFLALGGCAFFGSLVHGGSVAAGAAAGAAVAGPPGAAVGGVIGFYGGDLAAEQVTGTRGVRVGSDGKVSPPPGSGSLADAVHQAAGIPDMELIIWIAIGAFVLFNTGYGISLRGKLKNLNHDDEKWIKEVYEPQIAAAREQIAALREEVAALRSKTTALRRRPR